MLDALEGSNKISNSVDIAVVWKEIRNMKL
jgi:hypothetical protein